MINLSFIILSHLVSNYFQFINNYLLFEETKSQFSVLMKTIIIFNAYLCLNYYRTLNVKKCVMLNLNTFLINYVQCSK